MSEMEYHRGKLIPIETDNIKNYLERYMKENNIELEEYYDDIFEQFDYEDYEIKLYNGKIFKVQDERFDDPYFEEFRLNDNGEIEYLVGFYNGGTCLNEMLEEGVEKLTTGESK